MATTIVTKNSSTASAVPTAAQLVQGELAVNVADKRIFTENNVGGVVELGTNPSSLTVSGNIDVDGTANLDVVDIDGAVDMASTLTVAGEITANGGIALGDNDKATFGDSDDLQIYHDGSNSYIEDAGSGVLFIKGTGGVYLRGKDSDEDLGRFLENGAVTLYYNGSSKLTTTSTGIDVTGTASMDGLTVDGSATIDGGATDNTVLTLDSGTANTYLKITDSNSTNGAFIGATTNDLSFYPNNTLSAKFASGGDISFYEDTGTTPKFFWDASAESLGIGTSPSAPLDVVSNSGSTGVNIRGRSSDNIGSLYFTSNASAATEYGFIQGRSTDLRIQGFNNGLILQPSSGNVGIGTTSPDQALVVNGQIALSYNGTNSYQGLKRSGVGTVYYTGTTSGVTDAIHTFTGSGDAVKMTILEGGNVGIGESAPSGLLHLKKTSDTADIILESSGGSGKEYLIGSRTDGSLNFYDVTASTERMRIDSSGNLLVGTTSTPNGGHVLKIASGTVSTVETDATTIINMIVFRNGNGNVGTIQTTGTTTSFNTSSDQRLKENIADADDAGSKIDAIQVRKYDWKADGSHQDYGMIAQELQAVAPEAVSVPEDSEEMMGVDYSKLVPMLIKEIQSLRNRVAQLEE